MTDWTSEAKLASGRSRRPRCAAPAPGTAPAADGAPIAVAPGPIPTPGGGTRGVGGVAAAFCCCSASRRFSSCACFFQSVSTCRENLSSSAMVGLCGYGLSFEYGNRVHCAAYGLELQPCLSPRPFAARRDRGLQVTCIPLRCGTFGGPPCAYGSPPLHQPEKCQPWLESGTTAKLKRTRRS